MLRNLLRRSAANRLILGTPEVGILAATIVSQTKTGDNGPGLLYDAANDPVNAGKLLRLVVTSAPGVGSLFVGENGTVDFSGSPNGTYTIGYNEFADNVLYKADIATIADGVVDATAPGATLTATSDLTAGTATGSGSATAPGATLTGTSDLTPGAAAGQRNATAPGATLTGTADLTPGTATGSGSGAATALGATLTGTADLTPGAASGQRNATAPGATLTGTSDLTPGAATGGSAGDATAPGATLVGTSDLTPGSPSGQRNATAPGSTLTGTSVLQPGTANNGTTPPASDHVVRSAVARVASIAIGLPSPESFCIGETVRIALQVTDILGEEVDPPQITLLIKRPGESAFLVTLLRAQKGQYFVDLLLDKKGHWYFHAESTAPSPAVSEGHFFVNPSRF